MSRTKILAVAILGAWTGMMLLMWYVAAGSFATLDRVLEGPNPRLVEPTQPAGESQTRAVLRYLASEINRHSFRAYGWTQIILGAFLFFLLIRLTPRDRVGVMVSGFMLALALVLTLIVMPQIIELGRKMDFVPRNPPPPEMGRFRMLHGTFTGLDGLKLLGGLVLLVRWILAG